MLILKQKHWLRRLTLMAGAIVFVSTLPVAAENIGEIMENIENAPVIESVTDTTPASLTGETAPATMAGEDPEAGVEGDVTVSDLEDAGFTGAEAVAAEENKYQLPVYYFHVNETVYDKAPAWGAAANLVAVTVLKVNDVSLLSAALRAIQYNELHGRYQARFTKAGRYIVVTGPDEQKVANLTKIMEAKEFED